MAKSQYTDSITGTVLMDFRVVDNKFMNLSDYVITLKFTIQPGETNINASINNISPFSGEIGSLCCYTAYSLAVYLNNSINTNDLTVSFWINQSAWNDMFSAYPVSFSHIIYDNSKEYRHPFYITKNTVYVDSCYSDPSYIQDWALNKKISTRSNNTWYHVGIVKKNYVYNVYIDGNFIGSHSYSSNYTGKIKSISWVASNGTPVGTKYYSYMTDYVMIANQALWDGNFTPPNYYLTGDHDINKLSPKRIIYPVQNDRNDYFDKAFIY